MPRPIHATISRAALRHNLARVRHAAPQSRIWAVVKANAYGHGIERVYPALANADGIALLDLDEAQRVRALGWTGPILLLEGFFEDGDLARITEHALSVVVHHAAQLEMLERSAWTGRIAVYLKLNSGMNRLGFALAEAPAVHARLSRLAGISSVTLMTHFANADLPLGCRAPQEAFERAVAGLAGQRSLANSAAILEDPATHADWVRPGIMLYGASPRAAVSAATYGLLPVMTLASELIAVRDLSAGEALGYGASFVAPRAMRVGVVACGYADGYPRIAREGTPVAVAGQRMRLVGRVSMDMLTVDISGNPAAHVGSPVELWGAQIAVDEVAAGAATSGYEMLCALAARVPTRASE